MTVGQLRDKLALCKDEDRAVVLQISGADEYSKAYATSAQTVHDHLPDGDGGDDIHNTDFVFVIEAVFPP
jgi:hypothetical protein